ncbi:MAG: hypothetical protein AAF702_50970 [Chloroflexota bacterium]
MRIWLIGAGRAGTSVLNQFKKNPDIEVIVSDPQEQPKAVQDGILDKVDIVERITPVNINQVAKRIRPDLILISTGAGSHSFGNVTGGVALSEALNYEISTSSDYPCLVVSRSSIRP